MEYFFRGQSKRFSLSFAETSLWGRGGGSGRRLGVRTGCGCFLALETPDLPMRHRRPAQCESGMRGCEHEITHGPLPKTPTQPRSGLLFPHAPHNCLNNPARASPGSWGTTERRGGPGPRGEVGVEWGKRIHQNACHGFRYPPPLR